MRKSEMYGRSFVYLTIEKLFKDIIPMIENYDPYVVNHKVVSIELLDVVEDAYDITVENESHTFATASGVFIHNSDPAGFSGGTSLTKLDSRYARTIKRVQNSYITGITTLINLFALSKGLDDYVNNFTIKMVSPSTVEDQERDEIFGNRVQMISNFMNIIDSENIFSDKTRKEIIVLFVNSYLNEPSIGEIMGLDETVDKLLKNGESEENPAEEMERNTGGMSRPNFSPPPADNFLDETETEYEETSQDIGTENEMPIETNIEEEIPNNVNFY